MRPSARSLLLFSLLAVLLFTACQPAIVVGTPTAVANQQGQGERPLPGGTRTGPGFQGTIPAGGFQGTRPEGGFQGTRPAGGFQGTPGAGFQGTRPEGGLQGTPGQGRPQAQATTTPAPQIPTQVPYYTRTTGPTATYTLPSTYSIMKTNTYKVVQTITLHNSGWSQADKIIHRIALIPTIQPIQEVTARKISPEGYKLVTDLYGNSYAEFEFIQVPGGKNLVFTVEYTVVVRAVDYNLGDCSGKLPNQDLGAEKYIEANDPSIKSLAEKLAAGKNSACEKLRAFYAYPGDSLTYEYRPDDQGIGALAALQSKKGDCTEYSDVMIALSRAGGIPSRMITGVTYQPGGYKKGETEHNWVEAYVPGLGYITFDPTWGRAASNRDAYFARTTGDHIVITRGRNLTMLGGYSYNYYQWWGTSTRVTADTRWDITK
ncbi:MAG TPA: transglutaminase-like domain-containing protein [Anaerolineaceae bacterium]